MFLGINVFWAVPRAREPKLNYFINPNPKRKEINMISARLKRALFIDVFIYLLINLLILTFYFDIIICLTSSMKQRLEMTKVEVLWMTSANDA